MDFLRTPGEGLSLHFRLIEPKQRQKRPQVYKRPPKSAEFAWRDLGI